MQGLVLSKGVIGKYNIFANYARIPGNPSIVCPQILLKGETQLGNFGKTAGMFQHWRSCLPGCLLGTIFDNICGGD